MKYIVLTQEFCESNKGHTEGVNTFSYAVTNTGQFVTPANAKADFTDLFSGITLEEIELSLQDFEPDYTPPASNGKGIVIPEKFQWIFPVKVGGFTLDLKDKNGVKYAEESFLGWSAFVREIRKPENVQYRATILPVWNYGLNEAERIDL